jgi:hypothetical protein
MILGTPSRKDWIQNFRSLRWKFSGEVAVGGTDVFSSTQLMGCDASAGLQSQTVGPWYEPDA